MDFSIESLHTLESDITGELQTVLKTAKVTSTGELNENVLMKLSKNSLTDITLRLVKLYEKNLKTCKSAAIKLDQLKTEQIENQKKLLQIQEKKIDSVHQTVKTELKSWADVAKTGLTSKQITARTVKEAVRSVNDDEKRSRCFLIHGVEEKDNESTVEIVQNVYRKLNFNPPNVLDCFRVGSKTTGKPRSIKAEMEHPTDVSALLRVANKLKTTDFRSVYLAPDRNKEEQAAHSKLVATMRTMIKQDPSKYYFIRHNKVNSLDKTLSSDSG